jgi:hypothetical protein
MSKTIVKTGSKAAEFVKPDIKAIAALLDARGVVGVAPEVAAKRFVRYIASEESLDTMGDVILAHGWNVDEWHANPAMFADHKHEVGMKIAHGLQAQVIGKQLIVDCFYLPADLAPSPLAETCFKMIKAGILPDCSIGAVPTKMRYAENTDRAKYGEECWRVWESQTLKELSAVGIGANSRAKVEAVAKSLKDGTLTSADMMALRGIESLEGLAERAQFRNAPSVSVQVPPEMTAMLKTMQDQIEATNRALAESAAEQKRLAAIKRKEAQGLVLPLTVEDAEAILTYTEAIEETLRKYLPDDDEETKIPKEENEGVQPYNNGGKSLNPELRAGLELLHKSIHHNENEG